MSGQGLLLQCRKPPAPAQGQPVRDVLDGLGPRGTEVPIVCCWGLRNPSAATRCPIGPWSDPCPVGPGRTSRQPERQYRAQGRLVEGPSLYPVQRPGVERRHRDGRELSMLDLLGMEKDVVGGIFGSSNPEMDVPMVLGL
jgi:hypothetical protein